MASRKASANGRRIPDIFEPDIILPEQFTLPRGTPARGERTLLLAVLEMAVRDLELFSGKNARLLVPPDEWDAAWYRYWNAVREREALLAWFRSDSTAHACTFVSICETFNLHPDVIRRQLEQRGWVPARSPTHLHATAQHPRQLHGGYQGAG